MSAKMGANDHNTIRTQLFLLPHLDAIGLTPRKPTFRPPGVRTRSMGNLPMA